MKRFEKYCKNLHQEGDKIYSYSTHVATVNSNTLVQLGYWSKTTQKHINYVAKELELLILFK